ncbi:hypothetical protein BJY52DRAFT_1199332 [Lactarius psammicola]|nr:hypothetical protein BJY52DRAFT_1199332 [Lactarius psammicola]
MSATDIELKQIFRVVFSIISNGRENNSLNCLTPRLVRCQVVKELGLPKDALEVPEYKEILKCTINDAMQSEQSPEACASRYEAGGSGGSLLSKSAGSKEVHPGSGSAAEFTPSTSQSSPATKTALVGSKRKLSPTPTVQGDFDVKNTDTKQKSDSEVSSLVDEPIKKKSRRESSGSDAGKPKLDSTCIQEHAQRGEQSIRELKSLVRACGVQKKWGEELKGLDLDSRVAHIRKVLHDLGMRGQMSMEQAKVIHGRCELAQELDDAQRLGRTIPSRSREPFESDGMSECMSKRSDNEDKIPDGA